MSGWVHGEALPSACACGSGEDDGPLPVEQHPVLGVPLDGLGQHPSLHVLAFALELQGGVGVGGSGDVLLDDRPFIEVCRQVVGGGAD